MTSVTWYFLCLWNLFILPKDGKSETVVVKNDSMKSWYGHSIKLGGSGEQWSDPKSRSTSHTETCGNGAEAEFWFISSHVNLSNFDADFLYLDVKVGLVQDCEDKKCFSSNFEVYLSRGAIPLEIPKDLLLGLKKEKTKQEAKEFLNDKFDYLAKISSNTTWEKFFSLNKLNETGTQTVIFSKNKTNGVTFGIKSTGACGRISEMRLYYFYCEETFKNGVKFERTVSPRNGTKRIRGNCSSNSVLSNNEKSLFGFCHSNGAWSLGNRSMCLCKRGYEHSSRNGCIPCSSNHYKPSASNTKCFKCPLNSISFRNRTNCKCKRSYHRLRTSRKSSNVAACYGLPRMAKKPKWDQLDSQSVNVTWFRPRDDDGLNETLLFDVECLSCVGKKCNIRFSSHQYSPGHYNLTQTHVVVSGLEADKKYVCRVYPKNSLNQVVPRDKWKFNQTIFTFQDEDKDKQRSEKEFPYVVIIVCIICLILLIVVIYLFIILRKRRGPRCFNGGFANRGVELPILGNKMYIDPTNYDRPEDALCEFASELDPSTLYMEMLIGGGEFGDVYKGSMLNAGGKKIPVAVKTLKKDAPPKSEKDFLIEASVMGQFNNPNVIRLHGVVTRFKPSMIVIEYMSNGSLDNFLKTNDGRLTQVELVTMARGVAGGMEYLSGMNFVHRDIAARNILVNEAMLCKVSDFGLSRELEEKESSRGEYATTGGRIPIRWTAPEAIKYRKFSSASDVWSFGILLWEIMSFAERPYWEWDNFRVMEEVDQGFRLPAPLNCPKGVHELMLQCWKKDRAERPSFTDIAVVIDAWIQSPKTMEGEIDMSSVLGKWLQSLKMESYLTNLVAAGYRKPTELFEIKDNDLKEMGITLVGHRNKILKGIKALQAKTKNRHVKRAISLEV